MAAAFGTHKAAIHQNHGLFTVGRESVDEAAWWFIALQRACQIQLKAEATGHPLKMVGPEAAEHSRRHLATPFMAWLHFQPIYDAHDAAHALDHEVVAGAVAIGPVWPNPVIEQ